MPLLAVNGYDLAFIDGDHSYDACLDDIRKAMPLMKEGGILCGDDLDPLIGQCDEAFARANRNAQPATDPCTGRLFHPGVTLAVADLFAEVFSSMGFWAVRKVNGRFIPPDIRGGSMCVSMVFPQDMRERVLGTLWQAYRGSGVPSVME